MYRPERTDAMMFKSELIGVCNVRPPSGDTAPIADETALLCVKNKKIPVSKKITKSPRIATDLIPRTVKSKKKIASIVRL
jgi:hypothetical protein